MPSPFPAEATPSKPLCIFLTGVTGFVGGTILTCLSQAHPEIHLKALVRQEKDAAELQSIYPNLIPIIGDLSSLSLLKSTASSSDFVIHAAGDNIPAVHAIIDGLASTHSTTSTATSPPHPRLIALTGLRSLIDLSLPITGSLPSTPTRPWSDTLDSPTILSLPHTRIHAEADQSLIHHSTTVGIGTILLSPGQLFGRGKGHLKPESASHFYYTACASRGRAFVVGPGTAMWSWTSNGDLGAAVVWLVEQALMHGEERRKRVGVNGDGYYFVRTGEVSMNERARAVSERLGLGDEIESVNGEVVKEIHPFGHIMWGCGVQTRADKLTELGWRPKERDWRALMEEEGGERA